MLPTVDPGLEITGAAGPVALLLAVNDGRGPWTYPGLECS